jgi:drug/metabolite transporter (DMT)-like permease
MKKEFFGTLLAILAAIVSGFSIIANKVFIVDLDPTIFTAIRALLIGIVCFIISSIECNFKYKKFKMVPWKYLIIIGFVGGAIAFLLFFTGLKLTTGGRAGFLNKTLPIYVMIFAFIFLKEKITKKQVFAFIIMFIGLIVLTSSEIEPSVFWSNPSLGDLLIIFATILWAVENVISRYTLIKKESVFVLTFARMFFGAVFLFGIAVLLNKAYLLFELTAQQLFNIYISTIILFYYVFLWYWSIKFINVSKAATLLLLAPIISLVLGMIVLDEPVSLIQLIGSALILIGAYVVSKTKSELLQSV